VQIIENTKLHLIIIGLAPLWVSNMHTKLQFGSMLCGQVSLWISWWFCPWSSILVKYIDYSMLERNFIHCWSTFIFNVGTQFYIMLNTEIFYASFSYMMCNEIVALKLYVILHRYTFYYCYHCFLCEYMFMMFVLVTCLSIVYSSNRICMNLTLIIYASLKYKTMSKRDLAAAR
jgi:hypothetical protein